MKTVIGFVFVAAVAITPAVAWEGCATKSHVVATAEPATPVQTAEAPTTTQTK